MEVMVGMSMRAHSVRVINIEEEFGGGGGRSSSSMADLGLMSGSGVMRDAATVMAASSGNLREKFRREFDAFWSDPGAKRRPIATRDYIVRAVCPKLYGMHAVKLGLLLVLIGGASISTAADDEGGTAEERGDNTNGQNNEEVQIDCDSDEEAPVAFDIGGGNDDDNNDQKKKKNKSTNNNGGNHKSSNKSIGKAVKTKRRIQSHILLIGDPGYVISSFSAYNVCWDEFQISVHMFVYKTLTYLLLSTYVERASHSSFVLLLHSRLDQSSRQERGLPLRA